MFWRHKKNDPKGSKPADLDEKNLKHEGEPALDGAIEDDHGDDLHDIADDTAKIEASQSIGGARITPVPEGGDIAQSSAENNDGGGWLSRLTAGLTKSSSKLTKGISDLITKRKLDQDMLDDLEELLITADLGPKTASKLVGALAQERFGKDIDAQEVREFLAEKMTDILAPVCAKELDFKDLPESGPKVILVTGVNGVGKTTTIGKLAQKITMQDRKSVLLAAGDTFRAAAIEQLQIWGKRLHVPVIAKDIGSDAAAVAYESYEQAIGQNKDVLMIDTAGRLHNKAHLMEELQKISRVLQKKNETLPHEVLLILDATTGQNAHEQLRVFKDVVNVTGLIITKLDGSARGGVIISLADEFSIPIYAIGVGEQADDLQAFHPHEFARSLLGLDI